MEGKKKGLGMKAGFCTRQEPFRGWLCSFNAVWLLWALRMERKGNGAHSLPVLLNFKKKCRYELFCWDPNAGANFY